MADPRANTSYDFGIPPTEETRELIRSAAESHVSKRGLKPPLSLESLEQNARDILIGNHLDTSWLAYAMVAVNNALWFPVIQQLPPGDCLVLLPHCLRDKQQCEGDYDDYGFVCADCHACMLAETQTQAENRGYTVMISEATSMVDDLIGQGLFEAVIGVGCLESLSQSFQQMLDKALPGVAVPLLKGGCENTEMDTTWLREILTAQPARAPHGYAPPLSLAVTRGLGDDVKSWFHVDALTPFLTRDDEPTEHLATHWVSAHGKRWRPFLMAACEQAVSSLEPEAAKADIQRLGVAIECFHKASLIHDDIEDEDVERGGHTCLHVEAGVATALNVGDFLIGEGYRLAAECSLPAPQLTRIIRVLADCHRRLCLGQGREFDLLARSSASTPSELEDLFALKTSPAFEAALLIGGILGGADNQTLKQLQRFSHVAGVAYQIKDDLGDSLPEARVSKRSLNSSLLVARWREIHCPAGDLSGEALCAAIQEDAIQDWARERLLELKTDALLICEEIDHLPLRQLLFRLTAKLLSDTPV